MAVVIGLLFAGYLVLGGLDYGVTMVARNRADYDRIAPYFLGNEVWLVAAAGFMLGAYPQTEGDLLSAHRLPLTAGLVGAVTVVAALGMRLFSRSGLLDWAAKVGGILAAVGWGAALGDVAGSWIAGAIGLPVLLGVHGWAFLRRSRPILLVTSALIVAGSLFAGTRINWKQAPESTLDIIAPVAFVVIPLLLATQAFSWWLFRGGPPAQTRPVPANAPGVPPGS